MGKPVGSLCFYGCEMLCTVIYRKKLLVVYSGLWVSYRYLAERGIALSNDLVVINKSTGVPTTTSLKIAEVFGKEHHNVIKAIEALDCPTDFFDGNFTVEAYPIKTGFGTRKGKAYSITRDGFVFLAMGFTGKKAAEFKLKYIAAFNAMEQQLRKQAVPSLDDPEVLRGLLLDYSAKVIEMKPQMVLQAQ